MKVILENPLVVREMRRMRFWERRASGTLVLALLCAAAGSAMPLAVLGGLLSPPMAWQLWKTHYWISYFLVTDLITVVILWSARLDRSDRAEEQIRLTRLRAEEIELGRIWGVLLPIAIGLAIGDLALSSLSLLAPGGDHPTVWGILLVMGIHWFLLVSNISFTALMAMTGVRETGAIAWGRVVLAVISSHWLDIILIGFVIKPVFLLLGLREPMSRSRLRD